MWRGQPETAWGWRPHSASSSDASACMSAGSTWRAVSQTRVQTLSGDTGTGIKASSLPMGSRRRPPSYGHRTRMLLKSAAAHTAKAPPGLCCRFGTARLCALHRMTRSRNTGSPSSRILLRNPAQPIPADVLTMQRGPRRMRAPRQQHRLQQCALDHAAPGRAEQGTLRAIGPP